MTKQKRDLWQEEEEDSVSSGSLASVEPDDVTVLGGEEEDHEGTEAKKNREFTACQVEVNIIFWRNMALAFVTGTGIILSVGAYLCLSQWNQLDPTMQQKLPVIFTAAVAVAFANFALVLYFFARHVLHLTTHDHDNHTRSSKLGLFSIRPLTSKQHAGKVGNQKIKEASVVDATFRMDQSTDMGCPTVEGSCDSHDQVMMLTTMSKNTKSRRASRTAASSTNNSSDQAVKSLHQSLGNLQDFLSNLKRDGAGKAVAPDTAFPLNNNNHVSTRNIHSLLNLSTVSTMPNNNGTTDIIAQSGKPMAELFTDTTVLFADIEGFTAWSSTREPTQVFVLLETLYHAFDSIAIRRKVFKVETVGDCYMAVTGLPQPRSDHAVVMARFAKDILKRMRPICKRLTIRLGPDTCELNIRIGMHSGPVTGGLLRGERSRFQLFGDTVNTASRMESTGQGGMIHVSNATAELLKKAGKGHWVSMRPNKVLAKGLGTLQTYWLSTGPCGDSDGQSSSYGGFSSGDESDLSIDETRNRGRASGRLTVTKSATAEDHVSSLSNAKMERLIAWNVDLLHRLLKQIVARRQCLAQAEPDRKADADESIYLHRDGTLLEEVKESIELPSFNYSRVAAEEAENLELEPEVYQQLEDYVRSVANMYSKKAPFHGFEHASHVTMSVCKLLSRIVRTPPSSSSDKQVEAAHDHTYGITSDPLTQFACVLSALIHDADHPGVPNATLVKEQTPEAKLYKGKSVAESHSIDQCWNLLMEPRFSALRKNIYTTQNGLERFRSLVVNSVMATDICDPDLKNLRNSRWERAFNKTTDGKGSESEKAANDRKATIVIEHLIQASDVAHTMQHWAIYRKWNERLFQECYLAYMEGRADKDPAEFWFEGEKGFFDYYIIPLAKKLKDCGVFGVSSSEYLDYAVRNREEWEHHGKEVVAEMVERVRSNFWNDVAVNAA